MYTPLPQVSNHKRRRERERSPHTLVFFNLGAGYPFFTEEINLGIYMFLVSVIDEFYGLS